MKNWDTCEADVVKLVGTNRYTSGRSGYKIKRVVVHHNAGNLSIDSIWNAWVAREASAHYQVEGSGRIGQLVYDGDTAWHCGVIGHPEYNGESIGVEHANSGGEAQGWPINGTTLENGAHLVAALCKLYGLGRPQWYVNVFPHNYFAGTICPGVLCNSQAGFYIGRAQAWYDQMTGTPAPKPAPPVSNSPKTTGFVVQVGVDALNIRSQPSSDAGSAITGVIRDRGRYTIIATSGRWGKLKSGAGWIHLDYTDAVAAAPARKTVDEIAREVIRGEWGNGDARVNAIQAAGYNYEQVQAAVNRLL